MKKRKTKQQIHKELKEQEERIWNTLDSEAKKLDKKLRKGIKSTVIIGGTVLVGYALTKLLTSSKGKQKPTLKKTSTRQEREISSRVASTAIKALVPIAIRKINKQIKSTES